jgi:hypothetical protein
MFTRGPRAMITATRRLWIDQNSTVRSQETRSRALSSPVLLLWMSLISLEAFSTASALGLGSGLAADVSGDAECAPTPSSSSSPPSSASESSSAPSEAAPEATPTADTARPETAPMAPALEASEAATTSATPETAALPTSTESADPRVVEAISDDVRRAFGLDKFYEKIVLADGFPIVASAKTCDPALLEAASIVDAMLRGRADLRRRLIENRVRLAVMAHVEFTTDVPEHRDLDPAPYWNRRARGLGATRERPAVSCAEENLLGLPGDPYAGESILVHEFAHAIHAMALDEEFDRNLDSIYQRAMGQGLWKSKYAATNRQEYWAEAVQSWFNTNRAPDHDHNHVDTRSELVEYDPAIAELIRGVFPTDWIYVAPAQRAELAHLAGFAPDPAVRFSWPEELDRWYKAHHRSAKKPTDESAAASSEDKAMSSEESPKSAGEGS